MSQTQCYELFSGLKRAEVGCGDPRPGLPSTRKDNDYVERVRAVVRENRRLAVRKVADEVDISVGS